MFIIAPRSGLAWKHFIDVGAGVIDFDYRGPVGVVLYNHSDVPFEIKRGDRIAQMILERISMAGAQEVQELTETSRGEGGFGSTGVSGDVQQQQPQQTTETAVSAAETSPTKKRREDNAMGAEGRNI
jgi:hypothetical protein